MRADSSGTTLSMIGRSEGADEEVLEPHLFLLMNAARPREPSVRFRLYQIDEIQLGRSGSGVGDIRVGARLRITVPDGWMSSDHATIMREDRQWRLTDTQSKNGTRVNGKRTQDITLHDGDLIEVGQTFFVFRTEVPTSSSLPLRMSSDQLAAQPALATMIPELGARFDELARIAASKTSIVLYGASGTGKEMLAHAVHELSRRSGAFVPVNCAALPEGLVESELFGHVRGAFSGADRDRQGLIAAAHGGTLFLDEIGDLPLSAQAKLLRALQEQEVRPVGATSAARIDLRVVAATHRDLEHSVATKQFREDLLARLGGGFALPPLCERREDLGLLISALLGRIEDPRARTAAFSVDAVRAIVNHAWPRNVRELQKALERAISLADGIPIDVAHLPEDLRTPSTRRSASHAVVQAPLSAEDQERCDRLTALLREHQNNVAAVAREMGVVRSQIQRWMKRYGLS